MLPASARTRKFKGGEREGGDGRDPTLKNLGELMPAVASRYWNKEHRRSFMTKGNCAAPAHIQSKMRRKRGRDNVVDEVDKIQKAQHLRMP
jgi:hypothetical protein